MATYVKRIKKLRPGVSTPPATHETVPDTKASKPRKTLHHRRPTSIGGNPNGSNLNAVPDPVHIAWHALVKNMCAPKIAFLLNDLCQQDGYGISVERAATPVHAYACPPLGCSQHCALMTSHGWWLDAGHEKRKWVQWKRLCGAILEAVGPQTHTHHVVIRFLNDHLLDDDYKLVTYRHREAAE